MKQRAIIVGATSGIGLAVAKTLAAKGWLVGIAGRRTEFRIERTNGDIDSENRVLYLDESLDNWNEGLDRNMTDDMHLVYSFHNLFNHMAFSIFDLLWVRDFSIDLRCEKRKEK